MIDISFLKELDRFNLVLKKRVLSRYQGERQSHAEGQGLVFADYKDYVPGDDFRAIDWRVYARTDKFFVKQFEEERNMLVHIVVDASASMDFGRKITKGKEYEVVEEKGNFYRVKDNNGEYLKYPKNIFTIIPVEVEELEEPEELQDYTLEELIKKEDEEDGE